MACDCEKNRDEAVAAVLQALAERDEALAAIADARAEGWQDAHDEFCDQHFIEHGWERCKNPYLRDVTTLVTP